MKYIPLAGLPSYRMVISNLSPALAAAARGTTNFSAAVSNLAPDLFTVNFLDSEARRIKNNFRSAVAKDRE